MTPTEPAEPGDVRFTPIGDVEVFDGQMWTVVDPLSSDPDGGIRGDPGPANGPANGSPDPELT